MFTTRILGILILTATLPAITLAADANVIRLKQTTVHDAFLQQEALRFLAPADWKVESEILWRVHPTLPSTASVIARSPSGIEEIRFLPNIVCVDGVRESAMQNAAIAGPDAVRFMAAAHPEGSDYFGSEVRRVCRTPAEYLERMVMPRQRRDIPRYQIVAQEEMRDWAKASGLVASSGGFPAEAKAGKVRIKYEKNGKTIHEDFFVMLVYVKMGPLTFWAAEVCASARAELANLEFTGKILHTMMHSARFDLKWSARQQQVALMIIDTMKQQQRAQMRIHQILKETQDYVSNVHREVYRSQQESRDRMNLAFSQTIRGVEEYKTPFDSRPVELPANYRHAWANSVGEFILTDDSNFNPNKAFPQSTWETIERRR